MTIAIGSKALYYAHQISIRYAQQLAALYLKEDENNEADEDAFVNEREEFWKELKRKNRNEGFTDGVQFADHDFEWFRLLIETRATYLLMEEE